MKDSHTARAPRKVLLRVYTRFEERSVIAGVAVAGEPHVAVGGSVQLEMFHYHLNKVLYRRTIRRLLPGGRQEVVFPLSGIPSGSIWFRGTLTDRHGRKFEAEIIQDKAAPGAWWFGSREGISRKVPAPWTPLKTRKVGNRLEVQCWGRTYGFERGSLIERISSAGKDLLSGPVRLIGKVNGRNISWTSSALRCIASGGDKVLAEQKLRAGHLSFHMQTEIDFDGMLRVDCSLTTGKPVRVDSLILEIPMPGERAKYLFRFPGKWENLENARALPQEGVSMGFLPFVWLGDEERGLAWFCESDRNWFNSRQKCMEIAPRGNAMVLRLHLISTPIRILPSTENGAESHTGFGADAGLSAAPGLQYTFGFQATPVKPVEKDAWDHRTFCYAIEASADEEKAPLRFKSSFLDKLASSGVRTVVIFESWNDIEAHAVTRHVKQVRKLVKACHDRGMQALLYFGFLISDLAPEWSEFGKECVVVPKAGYPVAHYRPQPLQSAWRVCLQSPWQDFVAAGIARAMDELDADGVYLDSTEYPFACANTFHGCGATRPDGSIVPTYPIFAVRSAMRRIYNVVRSRKLTGQVNVHNSTCMTIPTLGWATSYWNGEQFRDMRSASGLRQSFPLDAFRTEFMGHQWGVPAEFLCYGKPFTYHEAWAFCLLHDVPVRPFKMDPDLTLASLIWKVMDAFGHKQAEWLPYWRNSQYVKTSHRGVYVSLYRHPQNGVLIVASNLSATTVSATLRLNLSRLGLRTGSLAVRDAMTNESIPAAGGRLGLRLRSLDWKLIRLIGD